VHYTVTTLYKNSIKPNNQWCSGSVCCTIWRFIWIP